MKFDYNLYNDTPQSTIDLFEMIINTKYDLEELLTRISVMETKTNICIWQHRDEKHEPSKTALWLLESRSSYISVAYCYNNYVNAFLIDAFYDHFEKFDEDNKISLGLRACQVIIELQNTLISIKSSLDRIIGIFCEYYRGISKDTTLGHKTIKEDGSASYTGFLSFCNQMKEKDEVFSYILSEYEDWIADCVKPRDSVVHYGDFFNQYDFFEDVQIEIPISTNKHRNETIEINIITLKKYVKKYYNFMDVLIKHLWRIELLSL